MRSIVGSRDFQLAKRFFGRTVIVTGAGSGLGAEAARQFAAEAATLVLVDIDKQTVAAVAAALEAQAVRAEIVAGDVASAAVAEAAVRLAVTVSGRLDVLFNNAGIDPLTATNVTETSEAQWDAVMAVNVKAAFLFARAAIPVMRQTGGGAIVNTASIAGLKPGRQETAYNVSKAALIQLTKSIALDYAQHGIRANCICPGFLESVMTDRRVTLSPARLAERSRLAAELAPLGREGRYAEIARAVLFLADSNESSYVTGAFLTIDGGALLA
jgi:NAD(P)-dependent dehydrogenase (short-subunit alcohol dehydrogenase family)